jgi:hypothetical protein
MRCAVEPAARPGRNTLHAFSASAAPVRLRSGSMIVPDARGEGWPLDREAFEQAIDGICGLYGRSTARDVAQKLEYPVVPTSPRVKEVKAQ